MKEVIVTILVITATIMFTRWTIKRSDRNDEYWNTQMEICGQSGWYTETGAKQDCQPVEYIRKQMETDAYKSYKSKKLL